MSIKKYILLLFIIIFGKFSYAYDPEADPATKAFSSQISVTILSGANIEHHLANASIIFSKDDVLQLYPDEIAREYLMVKSTNFKGINENPKDNYQRYISYTCYYIPINLILSITVINPDDSLIALQFRDSTNSLLSVYNTRLISISGEEKDKSEASIFTIWWSASKDEAVKKLLLPVSADNSDKTFFEKDKLKGKFSLPIKITEKSGIVHEWSDFNIKDNDFILYYDETAEVHISPEKIKSIEFLKYPKYKWRDGLYKVKLWSGVEKELLWQDNENDSISGNGPKWFESLRVNWVQKIEFYKQK